ncbi:MAG: ATP-dependent helicase HrpB [Victivallaceae bacterium]|nr:ATP-dependent helicase HrpB [Victivallaceae bacterium]
MSREFPALAVLPQLLTALATSGAAVVTAPPGSGKTTALPPELLKSELLSGKLIVMLEPRRAAARMAARRIAFMLGEAVGETVGYQVRNERVAGKNTRLEIVTEGILVRRVQADPELSGVGLIIFDEFHERSILTDLSLALTLDVRKNLREDLKIIVMSATIDAGPVAGLLGSAPVLSADGRMFPVETIYAGRPDDRRGIPSAAARAAAALMSKYDGDALIFLPGASEIAAAAETARRLMPDNVTICELYGSLGKKEQDEALSPAPDGRRKAVFSTNLAETSVTIEGVRIVVDSGLERVPVFDPATGFTTLETVTIPLSSAEQRRGRAGRLAPGICLRMWSEADERRMAPFARPEILDAELSATALELAAWGTSDLDWPDPPPAAAMSAARGLLAMLGLLDAAGRLTADGRAAAALPVHPRLAAMLIRAGKNGLAPLAAEIAVAAENRPLIDSTDLADHIAALRRSRRGDLTTERDRLLAQLHVPYRECATGSAGVLAALAYPDRIARQRSRHSERYLTSGGRGAKLPEHDDLARSEFLAVARLDGCDAPEAKIRLAAPITTDELEEYFPDLFNTDEEIYFDRERGAAVATRRERFGAIVLKSVPISDFNAVPAMLEAVRSYGLRVLNWTPRAESLRERAACFESAGDWSDEALLADLERWLAPELSGVKTLDALKKIDLYNPLKIRIGYEKFSELERRCPEYFITPAGSRLRIDYSGGAPRLGAKVQEFFGCKIHPLAGGKPLTIELLSPARRPIQITSDLPGFWSGSWELVKKEMKSRYPKHIWPDDPANAVPTLKTIKRKIQS